MKVLIKIGEDAGTILVDQGKKKVEKVEVFKPNYMKITFPILFEDSFNYLKLENI
ncbi:hypothetical protein [Bacillus sp. RO1]|uniref:hypothetical protein n=1 Tax=Bacillus sp. RO1 TaxID=2722703 RepID=UPI001456E2CD|nr:hypothetical protein [Bacillus sp. RO1]NLP52031.1 hypothetical protein [Bacillus sp. RO1]